MSGGERVVGMSKKREEFDINMLGYVLHHLWLAIVTKEVLIPPYKTCPDWRRLASIRPEFVHDPLGFNFPLQGNKNLQF